MATLAEVQAKADAAADAAELGDYASAVRLMESAIARASLIPRSKAGAGELEFNLTEANKLLSKWRGLAGAQVAVASGGQGGIQTILVQPARARDPREFCR